MFVRTLRRVYSRTPVMAVLLWPSAGIPESRLIPDGRQVRDTADVVRTFWLA